MSRSASQGPVRIVSATRLSESLFWRASYLGRSLERIPEQLRPAQSVAFDNDGSSVRGLSTVYNAAIDSADAEELLVFVHDDVYVNDWCLAARVAEATNMWDLVGVAGSTNPDLRQPSWGLRFTEQLEPDGWQSDLARSGVVNHFDYGHPVPSYYGPSPQECALLDGVFLACRAGVLQDSGIRFDEQFSFHLYDLDFCRSALAAGLRLGTWPISLTHNSGGAFGSASFKESAAKYLAKWKSLG